MSKETRIRWTPRERKMVIDAIATIRAANPKLSAKEEWERAMQGLPAGRARPFHHTSYLEFVPGGGKRKKLVASDVLSSPPGTPVPPEVPALAQSLSQALGAVLADALLVAVKDPRVVEALRGLLPTAVAQPQTQPTIQLVVPAADLHPTLIPAPKHNPNPPHEERERRLKVLIAGMRGHQPQEVAKGLPPNIDLRFWATYESPDLLKVQAGKCDYVFAMVDFLSHSHTQCMKARAKKYFEIPGGVSRMREAILREVTK